MINKRRAYAFILGIITSLTIFVGANFASAQTEVEKLQSQIAEKNSRLEEIEKEIKKYTSALNEVGAEKATLQKALNRLDLERKKIQADISYTENQIAATDLTINKLGIEIGRTENSIDESQAAISEIVRNIQIVDDQSLVEVLLRNNNISEFWGEFEALETIKTSMYDHIHELANLKVDLEDKKEENTEQKEQLESLHSQYSDQSSILRGSINEKAELLDTTKSKEANYQALLAQKEAARKQLQQEVQDIESQLQFILDPNTIPTAGSAVLNWPISNPIITQYFGYTKFALSGAYNGSKHNGIDLGTPVGTQLRAPLSGTVRNTGNTDAVPGCYSWGKWILVDHPNGLSSMFAHLSQISVTPGQKVNTGDIIGYTGNTGYSTGPHLHYTLYVKDAVQVKQFNQFKAVTGCGAALSPFAAVEGYLNPLDYLPTTGYRSL